MTFDELLLRDDPKFYLYDFIKLCLAGNDDKVRIDTEIIDSDGRIDLDRSLEDVRVIDDSLVPYYEYQIIGIYTTNNFVIMLKEVNNGNMG